MDKQLSNSDICTLITWYKVITANRDFEACRKLSDGIYGVLVLRGYDLSLVDKYKSPHIYDDPSQYNNKYEWLRATFDQFVDSLIENSLLDFAEERSSYEDKQQLVVTLARFLIYLGVLPFYSDQILRETYNLVVDRSINLKDPTEYSFCKYLFN